MRLSLLLLLFLITISVAATATAYAQSVDTLSKNNPSDVCKTGKNVQNTSQSITFCVDSKTKKKYIPKAEPILSTDGIFLNNSGGGNSTSEPLLLLNPVGSTDNISLTSFFTSTTTKKPAPNLLLLDAKQLCVISADKKCQSEQNKWTTNNLTMTVDTSTGNYHIKGNAEYLGQGVTNNAKVMALFYDAKGKPIGGFVSQELSPSNLIAGNSGIFDLNTVKSKGLKATPFYIVLLYSVEPVVIQKATTPGAPTPTPPTINNNRAPTEAFPNNGQ